MNVRIGYACKLLADGSMNITEIAYDSGFENLSNFNRQFKKIIKLTQGIFKNNIMKGLKVPINLDTKIVVCLRI